MPALMVFVISTETHCTALHYAIVTTILTGTFHFRLITRFALGHAMISTACMCMIVLLRFRTARIALIPLGLPSAFFT